MNRVTVSGKKTNWSIPASTLRLSIEVDGAIGLPGELEGGA